MPKDPILTLDATLLERLFGYNFVSYAFTSKGVLFILCKERFGSEHLSFSLARVGLAFVFSLLSVISKLLFAVA